MPTAVTIDDAPLVRIPLSQILGPTGVTGVADGPSGDQAVARYEQYWPDLVTLDIADAPRSEP